jgi:DNA (cytosine-5)-methyltransferase 1
LSGNIEPSEPKRKETPSDASRGIGADDRLGADQYNAVILGDIVSTLGVNCGMSHGRQCVLEPQEVVCFEPGIASREGGKQFIGCDLYNRQITGDKAATLSANSCITNSRNGPYVIEKYDREGTCYTLKIRSGCEGEGKGALIQEDKSATLATNNDQYLFQPVYSVENHPNDSRVGINEDGIVQTLSSRMGTGGGNVPMVLALDRASFNQGKNAQFDFEVSDKGINSPLVAKGPGAVCYSVDQGGGKSACNVTEGQAPTLTCTHGGEPAVCYSFDPTASRDAGDYILNDVSNPLINGTCPGYKRAVCYRESEKKPRYIVRRLTPLECERLQGYPDGWTDIGEWTDSNGKRHKTADAARYKALGNSIALPPWKWVLKRICACYERDATMASLFDGIGGFPYLWEQLNGKGTCLWASEIEEFPMAVTKVRIGE